MRRSIRLLRVFGLVLLSLAGAKAQTEYTADGIPTGLEEEIRWRINRGRFDSVGENQQRGTAYTDVPVTAGPLAPNQSLTLAARHHSEDMAKNNVFQHETVTGSAYYDPITEPEPWDRMQAEGYSYNLAAENIGAGYNGAEAVYVAWWNSAGHRVNMYNAALREIGAGYYYWSSSSFRNYYTLDLASSGTSCFFTDTLFRDANQNGVYDQTEGVSNVVVTLVVGTTTQSFYDSSTSVGSFAVPFASIPGGTTVQVVLSNATTSSLMLSLPRDYQSYASVSLASGERRVYGTFTRAASARNVGFRDLAPVSVPLVRPRLAIAASQSAVTLTWPSVLGQQYEPQWSVDFVLWAPLTQWQAGTGSPITLSDTAPTAGAKRFYRLVTKSL